MRIETLKAVHVDSNAVGDEYYKVGVDGITSIEWGEIVGHVSMADTVRVFKDGQLYSEHAFARCLGVYFKSEA